MNKKFLSAILFGALVAFSGSFVSCSDYDDDIDRIDSELADLKTQLTALQSQVNAGKYVTNVTKNGTGITITWSDGSSSTIETIKGDKGEAGAKGDAVVITIDPVTKNWLVDGVDTGVCAEGKDGANGANGENGKDGKDAPKPIFTVGEDGHIYVQFGAEGEKEDLGVSTGGIFYVDKGSYYELHVCDADGNWADIKLPMTKTITDLKAVTIGTDGKIEEKEVTLNYGYKVSAKDGLTFNGKTYAQNTYLVSQDSKLSVLVNPLDADATKYDFSLVDSKGNAPFVVSGVKQNKTVNPLSRAEATANQGAWDMTLAFASTSKLAPATGLYALTTETYNGTVASPYDVTVNVVKNGFSMNGIKIFTSIEKVNYNTDYDLAVAVGKIWWNYAIVDYYFEITDKTAAAANGVTLNGSVIKTTKNATFDFSAIKLHVLTIDGEKTEIPVLVRFQQVVPTTSLSDIAWTITNEAGKNVIYLPLEAIQSQLTGDSDTSIPTIAYLETTWADGTALDKKSVLVNGVNYGKDDNNANTPEGGFSANWVTSVDESGLYHYDATNKKYVAATTIQKPLFAKFTFNYQDAFPGEYAVKVGFRKNGETTGDYVVSVPVKVTITAPTVNPFSRLAAYFNGDEATAYGKVTAGVVDYNLFDLFQKIDDTTKANVEFVETKHNVQGHSCAAWLQATKGDIKVAIYNNTANADNSDNVYSTRAIKAIYTVFGNAHIAKVVDAFNLTVKSEIYEGTLTAAAAASVSGTVKDVMKIDLANVTAKDVYGVAYNLADTYVYNANTKVYDKKAKDGRIGTVELVRADANANAYLAEPSAITVNAQGTPYFTVKSLNEQTALQSDVTCKLTLKVTDVWGKIKTIDVTVTLKK